MWGNKALVFRRRFSCAWAKESDPQSRAKGYARRQDLITVKAPDKFGCDCSADPALRCRTQPCRDSRWQGAALPPGTSRCTRGERRAGHFKWFTLKKSTDSGNHSRRILNRSSEAGGPFGQYQAKSGGQDLQPRSGSRRRSRIQHQACIGVHHESDTVGVHEDRWRSRK